ncbi:NAD+ synthase [Geobacter pickeringii]|uniref:NH(3)-dependent NAD(+) synthetase n=1 Tax=Geobacter pickeringii TaxID=345632 RepID=A0A0B5BJC1_9BACT|nr:NAD+ synthase [Geobacter pickeringii]AJE04171.1 NAD synthetase [Geobacter pickeringii]
MGLKVNAKLLRQLLVGFIREEVCKVGVRKAVLGLSGGIDSALVAFLAAEALGPENVYAFVMPYRTSNPESEAHARLAAEQLGIPHEVVEITSMVESYFSRYPDADNMRRGNKMARERMTILYDQSAALSALVLGTSNKTELLLGYGTLFGDMASALNPIGDIYKTQVWHLSEEMGVPRAIIEKKPSADLWAGQTDEQELGFTYREVDELLYHMVDLRMNREELVADGFDPLFIDTIYHKIQNSHFKRRLPVIAKVSNRTIDRDFRYSRDWGK